MPRIQTVAVDFDGVIHRYSKGWHDGTIYDEPVPGAFEGLLGLMQRYAVFIFTSRDPHSVAGWIVEHQTGLPVAIDLPEDILRGPLPQFWTTKGSLLVTNRKLPAIAYVDDRAIPFISWNEVESQIEFRQELS